MMRLLSMAMIIVCVTTLFFAVMIGASNEIIFYLLAAIVTHLLIFIAFRNDYLRTGFFGLFYFCSLNGLVGNTMIGWKSGIFVLLFLLIPAIFYNPFLKKASKRLFAGTFCFIVLATTMLGYFVAPVMRFNSFQLQVMNGVFIIVTCLVLAGISYIDFRNSSAVANRLIELNNRLSYQASRDPLTDLLNRRTMTQFIEQEYIRSQRSGKSFGLIMTDVDNFKLVNDQHGHAAGDLVLMELSSLLTAALRKQDMVSRWGGEEFLILLPETDCEGVQIAAEKIRNLVSENCILYKGKPIQVTFSIGSVVCQNMENWDECIIQADRALYYGKNHGKNLAVFAKGELYCILGDTKETPVR